MKQSLITHFFLISSTLALAPLYACQPTPIVAVPTTLSTPGVYCLTQDFTASSTLIIIGSNDIVLDLNSYSLNPTGKTDGIAFDGVLGRKNITIKNGTLDGIKGGLNGIFINAPVVVDTTVSSDPLRQHDITLSHLYIRNFALDGITTNTFLSFEIYEGKLYQDFYSLANINIENCVVSSNLHGLEMYYASSARIDNSTFNDNSLDGALLFQCGVNSEAGARINNTIFSGSGFAGLFLGGCSNSIVSNCQFVGNYEGAVLKINGVVPCSSISFDHCTSTLNSYGFYFEDVLGLKLIACQASSCTYGFIFYPSFATDTMNDITVAQCIAERNFGDGFSFSLKTNTLATVLECIASGNNNFGFNFATNGGTGLVQSCKAVINGKGGFSNGPNSLNRYVSNVAQGNGPNPAGSKIPNSVADTNYGNNGVATFYTPATGGPGDLPFRQYGTTPSGLYPAGLTAWSNITLP